jgi:hypothetical protein
MHGDVIGSPNNVTAEKLSDTILTTFLCQELVRSSRPKMSVSDPLAIVSFYCIDAPLPTNAAQQQTKGKETGS